tara:strand:- start:198 stop:1028 length:831 start_codon:yes stop_codon:yes gene_type:complete
MAPCPVYPPGVLQTFTIPDPTSLDGLGELEITLIPSRGVTDINHISEEGIAAFKEMLYEADEDYRRKIQSEMNSTFTLLESIRIRSESIWQDNALAVGGPQPPLWFEQDCKYGLPVPWAIRIALEEAEEDADYEEWINSKQYVKSLEEYNRHKLLAWDKESHRHPKWVGHATGLELQHCGGFSDTELFNSYIKERYRVEVNVDELHWGHGNSYYAIGRTPYGDVYIPQKITEYLKDFCGLYEMDIALQDVEGAPGKKPNAFRWTGVYLHNKGFSLE